MNGLLCCITTLYDLERFNIMRTRFNKINDINFLYNYKYISLFLFNNFVYHNKVLSIYYNF